NYEIFIHDATTGFIQVTVTAGASVYNTGNFMSDDGMHIVYQSNYKYIGNPDGNMEIYLFDVANSALTQITNTTGTGNYPGAISGNGSRVVFFSNRNLTGSNSDGNSEVFLYDRTSGSITQVSNTLPPAANYRAEISFDGNRIFWDSDGYPAGNADGN